MPWSHTLEARSDGESLAERDPALARRISEIRATLDAPADRAVDRRLTLARESHEPVARARRVHGRLRPGATAGIRHGRPA
ncbi:hypothetical protein ACFQVC_05325 [Streptomyces monticola]|uniref:Uncharacterized protein n=1 Tax=Streptomyces monticola TaxID=2666263 RepID=A0ABW2JDF5_9ACTN